MTLVQPWLGATGPSPSVKLTKIGDIERRPMQIHVGVEPKIFQPIVLLCLLDICKLHLERRMPRKHRVKQLRRVRRCRRLGKCTQANCGRGWETAEPGQP